MARAYHNRLSTIDTNKPFVAYTLLTSCGCEKTVLYQRSNDGRLYRDSGEWEPEEPNSETDAAEIKKHSFAAIDAGEISGDAEDSGQMEAFILALFEGESIEAAVRRFAGDLA